MRTAFAWSVLGKRIPLSPDCVGRMCTHVRMCRPVSHGPDAKGLVFRQYVKAGVFINILDHVHVQRLGPHNGPSYVSLARSCKCISDATIPSRVYILLRTVHTTTTTVSPRERAETFRSRRSRAGPSFAPRTKHPDTSEGAGEHGKQVSQRAWLIPTQKWGSRLGSRAALRRHGDTQKNTGPAQVWGRRRFGKRSPSGLTRPLCAARKGLHRRDDKWRVAQKKLARRLDRHRDAGCKADPQSPASIDPNRCSRAAAAATSKSLLQRL